MRRSNEGVGKVERRGDEDDDGDDDDDVRD